MKCAFVGAGAVARKYASGLEESSLSLTAVCDLDADRAGQLAAAAGATAYSDLDDLLAAESAPLLVNLTSHAAHADVTAACLDADRHVFTEKPLALDATKARELVATADRRGLALGCAPINHACDAQRHARDFLTDGRFGPIRLGYAHAHVGRVTEWHDDPDSFLDVGPLYDGAVYPLSLLVSWFGPVDAVRVADALDVWPDREDRTPGRVPHIESMIEFRAGPVVRLTASLYAPHRSREFNSLELHGDDGSLYLADTGALAAKRETVSVGGAGRPYVAAPHPQPERTRPYIFGPERLAAAIGDGNAPIRGARRAAHVVAVCNAIERAAADGSRVDVEDSDAGLLAVGDRSCPPIRPPTRDASTNPSTGGAEEGDPISNRSASQTLRDAAIRLPSVGFGCSRYRDGEYVDRIDSIATALDAGYRLFDSAELYGNETRIGNLLDAPGSPDREGLFLIGKVWNTNHEHVEEACRGSLDELGVDAFDSYLLHWPDAWAYQGPLRDLASEPVEKQEERTFPTDDSGDPATANVSLEETWRRLEELHDRGLARTLGACNVSLSHLERLAETARVPPAIVQIESHPYLPRAEIVEWCHARGVRVLAHSPLSAPGLLTEDALCAVADGHDVSPAAVALAFHVDRGVVPIPASNDPAHLVANLAAARVRLTPDDRRRLATLEDPEFDRD
ncbi:aldo/keto reductase [Halobellus captivus]|uniref:aldo/keto reductase n=1 Tax=Halobellus captivus TaxID=2592614 RepID=UPI0011A1E3EC|nr:aldo/keto reductase [Halobellus captivus]